MEGEPHYNPWDGISIKICSFQMFPVGEFLLRILQRAEQQPSDACKQ